MVPRTAPRDTLSFAAPCVRGSARRAAPLTDLLAAWREGGKNGHLPPPHDQQHGHVYCSEGVEPRRLPRGARRGKGSVVAGDGRQSRSNGGYGSQEAVGRDGPEGEVVLAAEGFKLAAPCNEHQDQPRTHREYQQGPTKPPGQFRTRDPAVLSLPNVAGVVVRERLGRRRRKNRCVGRKRADRGYGGARVDEDASRPESESSRQEIADSPDPQLRVPAGCLGGWVAPLAKGVNGQSCQDGPSKGRENLIRSSGCVRRRWVHFEDAGTHRPLEGTGHPADDADPEPVGFDGLGIGLGPDLDPEEKVDEHGANQGSKEQQRRQVERQCKDPPSLRINVSSI